MDGADAAMAEATEVAAEAAAAEDLEPECNEAVDEGGTGATDVDPSVFEDMVALGKQIQIAIQEGTSKESYHRLGRVTASNCRQPWSMTWYANGEKFCVPKGSRQELKDNKHKVIPTRMRPDNHTATY